jgi:RimJ/RimL family protein N-acetyltransferase
MRASLPIATASSLLRPFTLGDARKVLAMSQERGMREWIPDQVYEDEREAARVLRYLIEQYDNPAAPVSAPLVLGICLRSSGELIGHAGLGPAQGVVEIGYAIEDAHQGKGLATEAARAMADWGLRTFALPAVDGIVASDNVGSCKVLEKAGFALVAETTRPLHGVTRLVRTYRRQAQVKRACFGPVERS